MNQVELDFLLKRLRDIPVSAAFIADQTGLTMEWVSKLRQGRIAEPGVLKICKSRNFVNDFEGKKNGCTSH